MNKNYEVITEHSASDLSKHITLLLKKGNVELVGGVSAVAVGNDGYEYISYSQAILVNHR